MRRKISLEDYLHFFQSHKQLGLTVNFLRQIIRMHGFKSNRKDSKKVLIDAVDKIDLENLSRSTVKEKNEISSCALMNMEDIVEDMKMLDWQECCVSSIQSLKAKSDLQGVAGGKRKRKRKRKRKMLDWLECCVSPIQSLKAKSDLQGVAGGIRKRKRKKGSSNAEGAAATDALSTTTALV